MSNATLERQAKADSIDRDLAGIAAAALKNYVATMMKSAGGESLTADEIHAVCVAAGRSVGQFHCDVKTARRRLDAIESLDRVKQMHDEAMQRNDEHQNVRKQIEALDLDFQRRRLELSKKFVATGTAYKVASSEAADMQRRALKTLRETAARVDGGDLYDPDNVKLD